MSHLNTIDIIRAWKDPEYRLSLRGTERAQPPEHPAGFIELMDAETYVIAGGQACGTYTVSGEQCCSTIATENCGKPPPPDCTSTSCRPRSGPG